MFLEESPPITKTRSRVQDVLLLILRCLAIALLILAFARPFFPAKDKPVAPADGAVMNFILLDTSASMRGDPSEQARKIAANLISGFPEKDWIAVAGFSSQLRVLLDPERARSLPVGERKLAAQSVISTLQADWQSTKLDASLLAALAGAGQDAPLKVHLIGDLQKGAALERLRDEVWPGAVQIILHPVSPAEGWTNAGVSLLPLDQQVQRARVINSEGSLKSDFTLTWSGLGQKTQISVPPGESAVFDAPPGLAAEGKVTLSGDDFIYDNETFWTTPARPVAQVWSPDLAQAGDASEGAYFLSRALQSTPDYSVEITAERPNKPPALTIVSGSADVTALLKAGGNVLFTMPDASSSQAIANILGAKSGEPREAQVRHHVLFGEIDFKSPVFAPFADARYSDFSSIRTWKYRILPADLLAKGKVLASFDSGDPAWLSFAVGKGTLHVLTTTWRPMDSQLALSTKFPPLLHALLSQATISISERGPLPVEDTHETPGIQRNASTAFTVQLDPAESERTPLPESELRALGLPLDPPKDFARSAEIAKEVSNAELESRQRLGWWLLVAAALFFLAETLYAGMAGRRQTPATS
jgi:hypothetical protein